MIELLAGAGIAAASYLAGHIGGRRARKTAGPPKEICQCGHKASYHDADGCHSTAKGQVLKYDGYWTPIKWEIVDCRCVRYVGPLSSYVPELDGVSRASTEISK